jgi:Ribonuclease G/E
VVRVAVVADRLMDYAVWRPGRPDGVGDVQLGRVTARVRALGGIFVALEGSALEGFLPDSEAPAGMSAGAMLMVRVTRAAQEGKGPRLAACGASEGKRRGPGAVEILARRYDDASVEIDDAAVAARLRAVLGERVRVVGRAFDAEVEDEVAGLAGQFAALPGGGRLRVQPTAALTAIDIDSGGGLAVASGKRAAHHGFNLAMVPELARQIRLRNLSGAILVDLAGLSARQRGALAGPLRAALEGDAVECRLVGFTGLGLAEIVRRRVHPALHEVLSGPHAAMAEALRAAVAAVGNAASRPVLRVAPDVAEAFAQDSVMRDDVRRSGAHALVVRSDPVLESGRWCLNEGGGA